jgi:hypothetical protein
MICAWEKYAVALRWSAGGSAAIVARSEKAGEISQSKKHVALAA